MQCCDFFIDTHIISKHTGEIYVARIFLCLFQEIQVGFYDFILQLLLGNKELGITSPKLKITLAKLCSKALIDQICIQTADVYRKENLNVVGGLYIYLLKNPCAQEFLTTVFLCHLSHITELSTVSYLTFQCE